MSQYVHDRWGRERGFPGGAVQAISQTPDGHLWIGTEKGLVEFDGLTFRLLTDSRPASPPIDQVLGLTADPEGSLWVRLRGPNLLRYRRGLFERALSSLETREDAVSAMCLGGGGAVFLSGVVNGILKYGGGRFETLAPVTALPHTTVISMAEASDGRIWIGTQDGGLFYLNGGRVTAVSKGLPNRTINCLLPLEDGAVWVGTDDGVVRWNGTELVPAAPSLRHVRALSMMRDRESNLWIGARDGLLRVNGNEVSRLEAREERSSAGVAALFEDREGNLWTGRAQGIERLRDSSFTTYARAEGLPSESNGPVHVDAEGRTWFAPLAGGLYWLRGGQVARVTTSGLDADVVYSIAGGKGGVWLGRQRGGLTHLRFHGDSWSAHTYTKADGLAQDSVYAVHESRDGTVWAGTLSGGVSRFRNGGFTTYTIANGLASNAISSIAEGSDGTMWFATPSGLNELSKDGWLAYTERDGLPSDDVNCLLEDSGGVLWIGTGDGLAFLEAGRIRQPRGVPASWHEQVLGLAEDRIGGLWMTTSRRVLRAEHDKLLQGRLDEGDVREYGPADGLYGTEGIKRHRSVVADGQGRVWSSMNRGLSVVDPQRASSSGPPIMVRIQSLSADGSPMDLEGPLRIAPGSKRVTFSYVGVSLSAPSQIRYRYQLDGFDEGWSEPVSTGEAVYTNLGPGPYRFRVTASTRAGLWNGPEATARVEIAPRVWQTGWFRLSGAVAGLLALLGLYRLRLRQLTRQLNIRFEERLAERTRIAQELHDTLLQGVLSASMQLHTAVDHVPADSSAKPRLGRVLELMRGVIEEGRNAVRGLRSPDRSADDLELAFSRVPQELGRQEEIEFRVIGEGPTRPLHPVIRDEVYRIGREALVNAFRHSRATRIEVEVEHAAKHLRILVRDNGGGIDPRVLEGGRAGHWGLPGMRERAERIGARLRVWSRAEAGTELELSVPGPVAYGSLPGRRRFPWLHPTRARTSDTRKRANE